MANRIVIDPVTRIEGHLRVEAKIDQGRIVDAVSAGTMIRGIELILQDRDPRDAWALVQRICGVCTTVHALTSLRAVENALQVTVPRNAEIIRNILHSSLLVHDHVVHFYHLHAPDWVDIPRALQADPNATAALAQRISRWPKSSAGYFRDVQAKLKTFIDSGQLGIFSNGYWGHSAYRLPAEVNLLAVAHYLEALDWQRSIVKIHAIFGGKNPHPNYVVGGMACSFAAPAGTDNEIEENEENEASQTITQEQLAYVGTIINEAIEFVEQVYKPDLLLIGSYYKEAATYGAGPGHYLAYGDLPTGSINDINSYLLPRGIITHGNLNAVLDVNLNDTSQIREYTEHSWYANSRSGLHPSSGETRLAYGGPTPPYETLDPSGEFNGKYSWLKSPRWRDLPMEVGPLARMLVAYAKKSAPSHAAVRDSVDSVLRKLNLAPKDLASTLGRMAARGIETGLAVHWLKDYYDQLLRNIKGGDITTFDPTIWEKLKTAKSNSGVGWCEAPRGALGHWVQIKNSKISNYQCVVPTTWNGSPRDHKNQKGALETALIGTPIANEKKPLELLRTIHSFDPCLACAAHLTDTTGQTVTAITVTP
ncbi:nickel-dependent hydrogenase large subunit [Heliophilum fasciatum]|uniref:Hydrogenase large subunit n=1 Tax=Heliophilum fasciatum TaxID=35700 RepID=A0A4R2RLF6_9FIRM|nr:nickel-dependent hydrogenase large subunit [Heliophilum fasciatum]MCW2278383.1 hydrogenase large subunit [Heliophilum fasciatum]TCP63718.1 hydrogenase large subunit [Heliophilum fasciatum]